MKSDFAIIADIFHFEKRFTAGFLFVIILLRDKLEYKEKIVKKYTIFWDSKFNFVQIIL